MEKELARFWEIYTRGYLNEMREQRTLIEFLAALTRDFGITLTLLWGLPGSSPVSP